MRAINDLVGGTILRGYSPTGGIPQGGPAKYLRDMGPSFRPKKPVTASGRRWAQRRAGGHPGIEVVAASRMGPPEGGERERPTRSSGLPRRSPPRRRPGRVAPSETWAWTRRRLPVGILAWRFTSIVGSAAGDDVSSPRARGEKLMLAPAAGATYFQFYFSPLECSSGARRDWMHLTTATHARAAALPRRQDAPADRSPDISLLNKQTIIRPTGKMRDPREGQNSS